MFKEKLEPLTKVTADDLVRQTALEQEMRELGIHRFHKRVGEHKERKEESFTNYGKTLLSNIFKSNKGTSMPEGLTQFIETSSKNVGVVPVSAKLLATIDAETACLIAAKTIINSITINRHLTSTAIQIGKNIETECWLRHFEGENPELYEVVKKDLDRRAFGYSYKRRKMRESAVRDGIDVPTWTRTEKVHIGYKMIELFIVHTGLCTIDEKTVKNQTQKMLVATEKTLEWINNRNDFMEILAPEYYPTIVRPKPWEYGKVTGGGYYTDHIKPLQLVKYRNKQHLKDLELAHMPKVIDALNAMQDTPYKINQYIYGILTHAKEASLSLGNLPQAELLPLPLKPHDIATNAEARKKYRKEAVKVHTENARLKSKRLHFAMVMRIAKRFRNESKIFFPHTLDFRGRAYHVPNYLNGQSVDYAKSLLMFAKGKAITKKNNGAFWLAVQGANLFGYDKESYDERVAWVNENCDNFLEIAKDPYTHQVWVDADKPFQFLAWCKEWSEFQEQGFGYVSHLICSMDGSCNGIQHYAAILKDEVASKAVNLVQTKETPEDVYQVVCDKVINTLKKLSELQNVDDTMAKLWLEYGVKRSTTKRTIMTLPYGSTRYSCTDFVQEDITKRTDKGEKNIFGDREFQASSYLARIIWDSIGEIINSARVGMDFLQKSARVMAKNNLPIRWVAPSGFPVIQAYPEFKSKRVKTKLFGEVIKPRINEETEKLAVLKAGNSLPPNFIHSQDSAHLMLTVGHALYNGVQSFCNVHDSFGTVAGDCEQLSKSIRETFVDMYKDSHYLKDFRASLEPVLDERARKKLPDVPGRGDLDLDKVLDSEFFFN